MNDINDYTDLLAEQDDEPETLETDFQKIKRLVATATEALREANIIARSNDDKIADMNSWGAESNSDEEFGYFDLGPFLNQISEAGWRSSSLHC